MRVAITGGTGFVGHFIVKRLISGGHEPVLLSRRPLAADIAYRHFELGSWPDLDGIDALVHAALDHVPGAYRGGEGSDAAGFQSRNLDGTVSLFRAARDAELGQVVFLSTRAVYGAYPPGTRLTEDLVPRPDTLYGTVKYEAEVALAAVAAASSLVGTSLRVTGVYGPAPEGRDHKWSALFRAFSAGEDIEPRIGTEVHGDDVAAAVELVLTRKVGGTFNVSDIVVDRADLLAAFSKVTGVSGRLPRRSDPRHVSAMSTERLLAQGWRPRGHQGLATAIPELCKTSG